MSTQTRTNSRLSGLLLSPHRTLALFWSVIGALTALAVLPYALELNPSLTEQLSLPMLVVVSPLQTFVVLIVGSWLGLHLGSQLGLDSPLARAFVSGQPLPRVQPRRIGAAIGLGVLVGLSILLLDRFVFMPFMPPANVDLAQGIPVWKGLLGSFYGGIAEELQTRLFVMTVVTWIAWRVAGRGVRPVQPWIYWVGIIFAAAAFGLGHLPVTAGVWDLTPVVVGRALTLMLLPGACFGLLYWRWGLEYAMLAHFAADLVLRGLGL